MPRDTVLTMSKALGDETRLAIYRHLTSRNHPVSVAQVAEAFGLHPNAARSHLHRLEEAGLAESFPDKEATSGRPPRLYQARAEGMAPVFEPAAFKALSALLLEFLDGLPNVGPEQLNAFGRSWGQRYSARWKQTGQVQTIDQRYILGGLVRTLDSWGFAADLQAEPPVTVRVNRCAFGDLSKRFPGLVCPLVHGVLQGMLFAVRPDLSFRFEQRGQDQLPCAMVRLAEISGMLPARGGAEEGDS